MIATARGKIFIFIFKIFHLAYDLFVPSSRVELFTHSGEITKSSTSSLDEIIFYKKK